MNEEALRSLLRNGIGYLTYLKPTALELTSAETSLVEG